MKNTETKETEAIVYNFYFSPKYYAHRRRLNSERIGEEQIKDAYVNGELYTEMIDARYTPSTNKFGDLKKVFSGSEYKITFSPQT